MGAWGTGIFSDDMACDVRAQFLQKLDDGKSPTAARKALLQHLKPELADSDDGPVIWLALAATQVDCDCLEEQVRTKALAIIEAGGDIQRWREADNPKLVQGRKAVLARLRAKLAKPRPKSKAPAKQKPKPKTKRFVEKKANFPLGEVFAYRLASGAFVLLHVVDYTGNRDFGFIPIVAVLDWRGEKLPPADEVRRIPLKTKADQTFGPNWPWMLEVFRKKEKEFPTDRVIRLGVLRERHCDKVRGGYTFATWSALNRYFE